MTNQPEVAITAKTQHLTLPIYNLTCGGGGALTVERILARIPGVIQVYVNPLTEMAYIEYELALSDSAHISAAVEHAGFGPRIPKTSYGAAKPAAIVRSLNTRQLAVAAGLWLTFLYTLSVLADLLFPGQLPVLRVWQQIFIGLDWANRWTLLLGLVEAFLYGALGAGMFAIIYNALPGGINRPPQ